METNRDDQLIEVFCEVLESLAFMFGEPVAKEDLPPCRGPCLEVSMSFKGEPDGELTLLVPESVCAELAANILGVDPDDEEAINGAQDALKELLNITCGQLMTAMAGVKPVFDLSVPKVEPCSIERWDEWVNRPSSHAVSVDETPIILEMALSA